MAMARSTPRSLLYVGVAAVVVAAVVLLVKLRQQPDAEPATPVATLAPAPHAPPPAPTQPMLGSGSAAPVAAGSQVPARDGYEAPPVNVYEVDGKEIRDHRTGYHAPRDIPPNFHAPDAHRIDSKVVHAITEQVQAIVHDCAAAVPPEARQAKPRVEGQIMIAIAGERVAVTKSIIKLRGVVGASEDPVRTCIEAGTAKITTSAPNEPDLAEYSINLSLAII